MPVPADARIDPTAYYAEPDVRRRLMEYCGAAAPGDGGTAAYLVGLDGDAAWPDWEHGLRVSPDDVDTLLGAGADLSRSLWDRDQLLFLLDLDYLNPDLPGEPFLHPAEVFFKLEPTWRAARRVLAEFGIATDQLMTGRGYHFTGRVPLEDPLVDELARLVPATPGWHSGVDARRPRGVTASLTARHARAADGLGLLLEHLSHRLMASAAPESPIPVVFNGTVVGSGLVGRECVSIDFSHCGDPLDTRHVRAAFSTYQWHRVRGDIFGPLVSTCVPPLVVLPRGDEPFTAVLERGRDLARGVQAARETSAAIPVATAGLQALLADYRRSRLAVFHQTYQQAMLAGADWTRRRFEAAPPCVTTAIEYPNDLLLKPEHLQQIVRSLMARGWAPAEVASLVRARYEEDHGWGDHWRHLDAATRAAFDVRVFAGMILTGLDSLVDCNCVSTQEKGVCPRVPCGYDLRKDRARLLAEVRERE